MITDLETRILDASFDASEEPRPSDLLEVTFKKKPNQKYKYLEAEPKMLGVSEIVLTVFFIVSKAAIYETKLSEKNDLNFIIPVSLIGIIAGSLAIAAQKLHIPTLKACLGLQIVMCVIYGFLLLILSISRHQIPSFVSCWEYANLEEPPVHGLDLAICTGIVEGIYHLELFNQLIVAVQTALSATLAVYCCKVIQCCCPRSYVPVIAIKSPTASE